MTGRRARRAVVAAVGAVVLGMLAACGGGPVDGGGGPTGPTETGAAASVVAFCAPYVRMQQALHVIDYDGDADAIAARLAPVMRAWAEQVRDLDRPPGLTAPVWAGLLLLARRILRLPEAPTRRQLDAVEGDLTSVEQRRISAAHDWFVAHCDPTGTASPPG